MLNELINARIRQTSKALFTNLENASDERNNTWEMRLYGMVVKSHRVLALYTYYTTYASRSVYRVNKSTV